MISNYAIPLSSSIAICGIFLSLSPVAAQETLPPAVEQIFQQTAIPKSALAAIVIPLDGTSTKFAHQDNIAMSPASTMKLLTSAIALEELGPTFRWKTQLLSDTAPIKNTLRGHWYLRGGGAPDLSWERLASMLRQLQQQGIRRIDGDLILDRDYFQPSRFDLNLSPFDESPDAYYNVIPDALLVHGNLSNFELDSTGKKMRVQLSPPMAGIHINNRMTFSGLPCAKWEEKWMAPQIKTDRRHRTTITLSGEFPRDCKINHNINVLDRNLYIESLIRQIWTEMGGRWKGHAKDGSAPNNATLLVEKSSDTLADNLRPINKRSDNTMTRLLYLSLGAEAIKHANTNAVNASNDSKLSDTASNPVSNTIINNSFEAAQARVRQWLQQQGIADQGLVIENGSGLSRTERITVKQMSAILLKLSQSNWFAEFSSSLPIAAIDGTMRKRLIGTSAAARARIKTGTLKDTVAVAGYVRDQHNKNWIVVAMINHEQAAKAKSALDALIEWVALGDEMKLNNQQEISTTQ